MRTYLDQIIRKINNEQRGRVRPEFVAICYLRFWVGGWAVQGKGEAAVTVRTERIVDRVLRAPFARACQE